MDDLVLFYGVPLGFSVVEDGLAAGNWAARGRRDAPSRDAQTQAAKDARFPVMYASNARQGGPRRGAEAAQAETRWRILSWAFAHLRQHPWIGLDPADGWSLAR